MWLFQLLVLLVDLRLDFLGFFFQVLDVAKNLGVFVLQFDSYFQNFLLAGD